MKEEYLSNFQTCIYGATVWSFEALTTSDERELFVHHVYLEPLLVLYL